jgi:hypothetical protein|nr:MAG TPA: hypothetical protein [Caudoviricetes sp.]
MDFEIETKRCVFAKTGLEASDYHCDLLDEECDGLRQTEACKFFKTKEEFDADNDKAIDMCRDKHLCSSCKYRKKACLKSTEGKSDAV